MPAPALVESQRRAAARPEIRRAAVNPLPVIEHPASPLPRVEHPGGPPLPERPVGRLPVTEMTPAIVNAPSPAAESLASELNLLRQAQDDLRLGLPAQALRRLEAFDRHFPRAKLDQERQAIEAIASCQLHPGPAATARAQRFLQQAPLSPLAARVRSACQADEDKSFNETSPRREP